MVIIYGGIQPDGLVLSIHTVTIDTSKRNRSTVLPGLITPRPTFPPTPPPIRGTVPPLSKWAPYDRANPKKSSLPPPLEFSTQSDAKLRDWANRMFQFKVLEDAPTVTTHKTITSTIRPLNSQTGTEWTTGSSIDKVATTDEVILQSEKASQFPKFLTSPRPTSRSRSPLATLPTVSSTTAASSKLLPSSKTEVQLSSSLKSNARNISLEQLLLQTLDKLANQYRNSSSGYVKK